MKKKVTEVKKSHPSSGAMPRLAATKMGVTSRTAVESKWTIEASRSAEGYSTFFRGIN
jgi:hypothetical protein